MRGIRTVHHASESTNTPHESSSDLTEEDASNPSNFGDCRLINHANEASKFS